MLALAQTVLSAARLSHSPQRLCSDTCPLAHNGVCDDGGAALDEQGAASLWQGPRLANGAMGPEHHVGCDVGTDCADCGARIVPRPASLSDAMPSAPQGAESTAAWSVPPVAFLRSMDVEVRAAWTRTQPSFIMPYTDPSKDVDVSGGMASGRLVEATSTLYFGKLSRACCRDGGLMLDVGSNFGWFALYAASMGCRVVAWEPVPVFRAFLELGAQLNNLTHLIHVRAAAVSDAAGRNVTMRVPRKGLWGAASVDGLNVLRGSAEALSGTYSSVAPTETLDGLVREQACAMKMDVEGFEPFVVDGARATLRARPPRVLLTEYTPGVAENTRGFGDAPRYPRSLQVLREAGYSAWQIAPFGCGPKNRWSAAMLSSPWKEMKLWPCPAVTDAALRAEARGAENMAASRGSFAVPWDLHPASLHATFAHNTDLLLALESDAVPTSRAVGVTASSPIGLGGGTCNDTLRDAIEHGNVAEAVGRRCIGLGRAASLADFTKRVEAPHGPRGYTSVSFSVKEEARAWRVEPAADGPPARAASLVRASDGMRSDGKTPAEAAAEVATTEAARRVRALEAARKPAAVTDALTRAEAALEAAARAKAAARAAASRGAPAGPLEQQTAPHVPTTAPHVPTTARARHPQGDDDDYGVLQAA